MPTEEHVCPNPGVVIDTFTVVAAKLVVDVRDHVNQVPVEFSLSNYPNPFNPSTTIAYNVPQSGSVKIMVFDLLGRNVATLLDGVQQQGNHTVDWNAKDEHGIDLPSGVYVAQLQAGKIIRNSKMILLR
jgi:hypothetical protein